MPFWFSVTSQHCQNNELKGYAYSVEIFRASRLLLLWSPYGIGQTIIFSSCRLFFFFLLSLFFTFMYALHCSYSHIDDDSGL